MPEIDVSTEKLNCVVKHLENLNMFNNGSSADMIEANAVQVSIAINGTRKLNSHIFEYPAAIVQISAALEVSNTIALNDQSTPIAGGLVAFRFVAGEYNRVRCCPFSDNFPADLNL
jgi:hypothetical protein